MEKTLALNAIDFGVEESKAKQIEAVFVPMVKMLKAMEEEYDKLIKETEGGVTNEIVIKAKSLRSKIARVRIDTENERKKEKEVYLRGGKAVDGIANILKNAVIEKENNLKEIENFFENQERERRIKLLLERKEKLRPFEVENLESIDLSGMSDEVFNNFLLGAETNFKAKKEAEEKEKAEKNDKYKAFLEKNNFDKETMRIQQENNTFTIWKKLDSITI